MCEEVRDNGPLPQALAIEMIPVIRRIAYRLAKRLPSHVCIDDLISAGVVGLITAHRRFDPARGDDFRSYAELRIRGAMIDELRASDPLSRDLRAHANRTLAARRALESRLGRSASEIEIAQEMGLSLESFRSYSARAAVGPTVSLDAPNNGETALQVGDPDETPADERLLREQSKLSVRRAIEVLPPRLRQVIELYYGDERTLRDIGSILGVTESRVCQLQAEAVLRMRAHCARTEPLDAARVARRVPRLPAAKRPCARAASLLEDLTTLRSPRAQGGPLGRLDVTRRNSSILTIKGDDPRERTPLESPPCSIFSPCSEVPYRAGQRSASKGGCRAAVG